DGQNYIATELIDGTTLRQHLAQKEPLALNTILKIGVQVAEALSAAHQAGIIHRDIKPENVMIRRDGYAKVLDFGLAKLSEPGAVATGSSGSEDATRIQVNTNPGVVMGTVSYMSPEQARGNPTDARTDIWSLGVVLYEMLARRVPFTGDTTSHTIVSILEKEPFALENVPGELQRIVRKALTKDTEMRYQSARDLLIDLNNLRRDLDIQGEIERSVIPSREITTGPISEQLNPNYPQSYGWNGARLMMLGRYDESLAEIQRGLQIDPTSNGINFYKAVCLAVAGRRDEAIQQLKKLQEMDPTFTWAHGFLARVYVWNRNYAGAAEES